MTTDTSERGLEDLIVNAMTGGRASADPAESRASDAKTLIGGSGWTLGDWHDYDREYCLDLHHLQRFIHATQPKILDALDFGGDYKASTPTRQKFLARLQGEISKRGVIDVLRKGIQHNQHHIKLFYGTPTPGNRKAEEQYFLNRFTVTRQLRYSRDETQLALDLGLFINGLPIATFELKNSLTKQTVSDAVEQYKNDRDSREKLFEFGRCVAHFAVDDQEVRFCTYLKGKASWFLPFNQGWNDGAGNPPNPNGLKTDYLWRRILTPQGLTDILENYAQVVEEKDEKTGKKKRTQIFPRFHQLDVVRKLLADAADKGVGQRYLIQHSAGSGKSNSIAWLAHQLIGLQKQDAQVFDSIIVVTDRRILDKQIRDTIKQFAQVGATVGHAEHSSDLREFIEAGKKIIITTVQKFPIILKEIGSEHRGRNFAILIDEAHSSQGGKTSRALSAALAENGADEDDETPEDRINRIMEAHKLLPNASYFAFTATPKNKTLELFGVPEPQPDGKVRHRPFQSYTMKQAIQEGFILDVLAWYTPVNSYYKLIKTVESDPEFDTKRAKKKLRRYVESHDHAIGLKAEIMVDHFHEQVLALNKIGGQARAMVVTNGIERAIQYFHAFRSYLQERKSPYQAIVAFSGEHEYGGAKVTEASLNGFPSNKIEDKLVEDPYRFLICADKFQTGYDEPLLHTMYVDKTLSGIKAVQTLSRLNRAHPMKKDVFVLDFMNDTDTIEKSFADYYRTTVLSEETDPNKLHDLKSALDGYQVYSVEQITEVTERFLSGAPRDSLDPILDTCQAVYSAQLDEDGQVDFKGKAKAFTRTYGFLASILPYTNAEWERLSIFLNFLIPKLPAPVEQDLSRGILETIDMDSYRVEKQSVMKIQLPDANAELEPVPTSGGGRKPEAELDRLSNILKTFNEHFGNVPWSDRDRVNQLITQDIPARVSEDKAYKNARQNSDRQNARIEHDKALARVMTAVLKDDTELFKQFMDNESFRRWMTDTVFSLTYGQGGAMNVEALQEMPVETWTEGAALEVKTMLRPTPWVDDSPERRVTLLFATTRQPSTESDEYFSGERDPGTQYGKAAVRIPEERRLGEIPLPFSLKIFSIALYDQKPDPKKHFVLQGLEVMDKDDWYKTIQAADNHEALVFIHGFNVSFMEGVYRCAQIAWDIHYGGIPILFSWASRGHVVDYGYDRNSALIARDRFIALLEGLQQAGITRVHVLAHSMGNLVALDALASHDHKSAPLLLSEVLMAAPDVDSDHYRIIAPKVRAAVKGMTLYASSADKAMTASKKLAGNVPRAGDVPASGPVLVKDVDAIDVTEVGDDVFGLNHGAYAAKKSILNDIKLLLSQGIRPPSDRLAEINGMPQGQTPSKWWRYVP